MKQNVTFNIKTYRSYLCNKNMKNMICVTKTHFVVKSIHSLLRPESKTFNIYSYIFTYITTVLKFRCVTVTYYTIT